MLAVIEDDEHVPGREIHCQCVDSRSTEQLRNVEGTDQGVRHETRIGKTREIHEPHTVAVHLDPICRCLQREPGLTCAAGTGQRHQPGRFEGGLDRGQLRRPANEARQLGRKVVPERAERAQRRELGLEPRVDDLADVLGPREVTKPVLPEVQERDTHRQDRRG